MEYLQWKNFYSKAARSSWHLGPARTGECPWFPSMDSTLPRHPFHYIQPHGALFLSKGLQGDGLIELSGSLSWALIILWLPIVFWVVFQYLGTFVQLNYPHNWLKPEPPLQTGDTDITSHNLLHGILALRDQHEERGPVMGFRSAGGNRAVWPPGGSAAQLSFPVRSTSDVLAAALWPLFWKN